MRLDPSAYVRDLEQKDPPVEVEKIRAEIAAREDSDAQTDIRLVEERKLRGEGDADPVGFDGPARERARAARSGGASLFSCRRRASVQNCRL